MFRRFLQESSTKKIRKNLLIFDFLKLNTVSHDLEKDHNNDDQFCLIRWSDRSGFSIVSPRCVRAPSNDILVYERYTIEINGKQSKGTVVLKGMYYCFWFKICVLIRV